MYSLVLLCYEWRAAAPDSLIHLARQKHLRHFVVPLDRAGDSRGVTRRHDVDEAFLVVHIGQESGMAGRVSAAL